VGQLPERRVGGLEPEYETHAYQTDIVPGGGKADCGSVGGRVEVCNDEYGETGWLGIASIWVTRGKNAHITQGTVQVNDTYFNTPTYDSAVWRQLVTCQEIGHTLGLDHQDENFYNAPLGTCMDYTANPTEADAHPNRMTTSSWRASTATSTAAAPEAARSPDHGETVARTSWDTRRCHPKRRLPMATSSHASYLMDDS
jgi:hypothetical protein